MKPKTKSVTSEIPYRQFQPNPTQPDSPTHIRSVICSLPKLRERRVAQLCKLCFMFVDILPFTYILFNLLINRTNEMKFAYQYICEYLHMINGCFFFKLLFKLLLSCFQSEKDIYDKLSKNLFGYTILIIFIIIQNFLFHVCHYLIQSQQLLWHLNFLWTLTGP